MTTHHPLRRLRRALAAPFALALLLGSCDGGNGWRGLPTGAGPDRRDAARPQVDIIFPDSTYRVPIQDSVLVRVRVRDDVGVDSVTISGFAVRGSVALGTDTVVPRFLPKTVSLAGAGAQARDTVLLRYLLPTTDSIPETAIRIVVSARDSVGNVTADTVRIAIGGPRVQIREPAVATDVRRGTRLKVRVFASDTVNQVEELTLRLRSASSGSVVGDTTLRLDSPRPSIEQLFEWTIPANAPAEAQLQAIVRSASKDTAVSIPVPVRVLPAVADQRPPTVTFSTSIRARSELGDSAVINVAATDSTQVERVGATVRAIHRLPTRTDTLTTLRFSANTDSTTFRFTFAQLGLTQPLDTSTVRVEVTAFAFDTAGNCGAATVLLAALAEACNIRGDTVFATRSGAFADIILVRGATVRPTGAADRLADLAVDSIGRRVFVSNFTRNRVEVLPVGASTFSGSFLVGSEPWGLAIGINRDTLFVANSGGTLISSVPLNNLLDVQSNRISPANLQLFGVEYDVEKDSVNNVVLQPEYSDRPQFIGQISSGQLIYSTRPTSTAGPGTIRIFDRARDRTAELNRGSEIFVGYATPAVGKAIVVNALSAGLASQRRLAVCPRRRLSSQTDPACITGTATEVADALAALAAAGLSDTRLDLGRDVESINLTDTTFVATSRDNSTIAFGEGATNPGRVFLFRNIAGALRGSTTETGDLVGNAAERVTSLALNGDGSLGLARGLQAYFFDSSLRQQGVARTGTGTPTGGSALHPLGSTLSSDPTHQRGFVTGVDESGAPYIDVINTFNFTSVRRIFIRDQIVGSVAAVPVVPGEPDSGTLSLRIFGITTRGVLQVGLTSADLQ